MKKLNFIDLFAGASGMSEGFTNAGFNPVAHIEMNEEACFTIKTRAAQAAFSALKAFLMPKKSI